MLRPRHHAGRGVHRHRDDRGIHLRERRHQGLQHPHRGHRRRGIHRRPDDRRELHLDDRNGRQGPGAPTWPASRPGWGGEASSPGSDGDHPDPESDEDHPDPESDEDHPDPESDGDHPDPESDEDHPDPESDEDHPDPERGEGPGVRPGPRNTGCSRCAEASVPGVGHQAWRPWTEEPKRQGVRVSALPRAWVPPGARVLPQSEAWAPPGVRVSQAWDDRAWGHSKPVPPELQRSLQAQPELAPQM
ncbi:hypothetical protein BFN03_05985 [Rhodococcus sp. WMMA185]|nr:hypothetical protein BFN03_05985 [Rhodococcus sp. WMMA185]